MNMVPSFTTLRSFISYHFAVLRMRALRDQFWAKLSGTQSELAVFPGNNQHPRFAASRRLIGLQNIRVDQIVGSLNRNTDFDYRFRPLKKHNLDRWVNTYILQKQDGWPPIVVHKIGEQFFVEDGHHRVSVARMIGMDFIDAKVWEHEMQSKHTVVCPQAKSREKSSTKVYAAG